MRFAESHVNATEHYRIYDDVHDVDDLYLGKDPTIGEIYRECRERYGRCTGKVYVDTKKNGTKHVGWVFVKREKYDDCNETFLREVWITLYDEHREQPIRKYHYI